MAKKQIEIDCHLLTAANGYAVLANHHRAA
jgi:hypothetical protein